MTTELRDYLIAEGRLDEWVEGWLRQVLPLRQKHGFSVDAAWIVEGENRFVWLLSREGDQQAFEAANLAYYDSPERKAIKPDPARLIIEQRHMFLRRVPLSG